MWGAHYGSSRTGIKKRLDLHRLIDKIVSHEGHLARLDTGKIDLTTRQ